MNNRATLSMRWKLILASVLVEAVMLVALVWNGLRLTDESLQRQFETRLGEISVLLNAALGPALAMQDYAPVAEVFNQSRRADGIQYFVLADPRGRRLLSDGWPADAPLPLHQTLPGSSGFGDTANIRIPITLATQTYGHLHFGISTKFLFDARQHIIHQSLVIATLAILISLLLISAIALWITRHLKQLQLASEAVSKGDYSVSVKVDSTDEIGKLATAFNHMADHIGVQLSELSASEMRFKSLLNLSTDTYWEQDSNFRFTLHASRIQPSVRNHSDYLLGKQRWELDTTLTADEWAPHQEQLAAHQTFRDLEYGVHHPDGTNSYHLVYGEPIFDETGSFTGYRGTATDITQRKQLEASLRLSATVFAETHESIIVTDKHWLIVDSNPTASEMTGYDRSHLQGRNALDQFAFTPPLLKQDVTSHLTQSDHWRGEASCQRKTTGNFPSLLTISIVRDPAGATLNFIFIFSDITTLKTQQEKLEALAHYDALTHLPNRVLLADRLQHGLLQARRNNELLAVAYLDLDGFKQVNDSLGHDAGDMLLIEVAARLLQCMRCSDTVARLGGDEFVLLLHAHEFGDCEASLLRVLAVLGNEFFVNGQSVSISASIGVTLFPYDNADPDVLLRHADQAMYIAKQSGRNRYNFFDADLDHCQQSNQTQVARIATALTSKEFELFYQPKVDMRSGEVFGVEALIRWQHPERGTLSPADFLPLIEESELAVRIGEWVLKTAVKQQEIWQKSALTVSISVNITPRHIESPTFVQNLHTLLAEHPTVSPATLELEIVESASLEDIQHISEIMSKCVNLGVSFALDDFGTGYSSLTYFRRLPAQTLKIDQSFIRDMLVDPEDMAIAQGVIGLAQAFHRTVIAEGVETTEHGTRLLEMGCHLAQGYGIARPMPAKDFPDWIKNFQAPQAWTQARK